MGKVRFGLSNVHYATYGDSSFDTPVAIPGAVQLTLEAQGESSTFYADNGAYASFDANGGYTGTFQAADAPDDFLEAVIGYETDETSGLTYEATDAVQKPVALLFEVSGNQEKKRYVLYNCTFSRPSMEANTTNESVTPDTRTLNFTAIGRDFSVSGATRNVTLGSIENTTSNKAKYDTFFEKVMVPGVDPTQS